MPYRTTLNKDTIRVYDKERIRELYEKKGRKLRYIGLPSPDLNDIIEWREFLGEMVAIERGTRFDRITTPHHLLLKATMLGLRQQLTLIRGELDNILMAGKHFSGKRINYPFDITFFDFFGGILNKRFERVRSLKKFIENQIPHDFLLLMTFNLRHAEESEESTVLDKIEKELRSFTRNDDELENFIKVLDWYKSKENPEQYRQKVFVPYLLREAEFSGYKVHSENPVYYLGYNDSPMAHFVAWFNYDGQHTTRAISEQTLFQVVDLDLFTVREGMIEKCDLQAPKLSS